MLIIGLGLAMSVSMIQVSVRSTSSANNQNIASELAESIISRMRINRIAAHGYLFGDNDSDSGNNTDNFDLFAGSSVWKAPTITTLANTNPAPDCSSTCTAEQITARENAYAQAYADTVNWVGEVQSSLPVGRAIILELPVVGTTPAYRVVLQWQNVPMSSRVEEDEDTSNDSDLPVQELSLGFSL